MYTYDMSQIKSNIYASSPTTEVSLEPQFEYSRGNEKTELDQEVRKAWEISRHCSSLIFPAPYPDISLDASSSTYYYLLHTYNGIPDQELVHLVKQAHYSVLSKLNQSELQVKNFLLPVQLMKLKYVDPYSRKKIISNICKYLRLQTKLRSVVLEQADITLVDLCHLLLALAENSHVKNLYMWNVLSNGESPSKGPIQSDTNLNYLPRIPYTYNPGGRKYLRQLKNMKNSFRNYTSLNEIIKDSVSNSNTPRDFELPKIAWMEKLLNERLNELLNCNPPCCESYEELLKARLIHDCSDSREHVYFEVDAEVQCNMSQESDTGFHSHVPNDTRDSSTSLPTTTLFKKTKINCCKQYLKSHEYSKIHINMLREIYTSALNGLTNLKKLSINYSLVADETGNLLLAIGSVIKGKLADLELLCKMEDLPCKNHQQYDQDAKHAIPDITWKLIKNTCPYLKVHLVCVSMSVYDVTSKFITRSIPLNSLHISNGFCPTLMEPRPQIMFFSTLKCLREYFNKTLEHVSILLWHSSGKIDSSLVQLIKETPHLKSFEYYGPLQYKISVNKLCDAALLPSSEIINFKLMLQGDPCYPQNAVELTQKLYMKYKPIFTERSIQFMLGTHNS